MNTIHPSNEVYRVVNTRKIIHTCLDLVRPKFALPATSIHGIAHWARVWRNAREICTAESLDPTVPCMFSFLHDSCRENDGSDYEHGHRAVEWIYDLYSSHKLAIQISDFHLLCTAIAGHSDGETESNDPIIEACWDADRLDLGRVGIMPKASLLCTKHARKRTTIEAATRRAVLGARLLYDSSRDI